MSGISRFLNYIYQLERAVALLSFLVMTLVIIADVISRKTAGVGIPGAARVAVYAMIVTALISFGLASHTGRHLRPKFADGWLPRSWTPFIIPVQEGLTAIFCLVFAVVAVQVVYETYLLREASRMLRIMIWPMQAVIPVAFAVGFIRHGLYALYPAIRPAEDSRGGTRKDGEK